MNKKMRTLLLACVTILLCVTMIAGGTYALFTDEVRLSNHLIAGDMDITLERIALNGKTLNNTTGFLDDLNDTSIVDFSGETTENVFGLKNDTLIVPESSYKATMKITNGSDVAFGYWLEIKVTGNKDAKDDTKVAELLSQLTINVKAGDKEISQSLADLTVGAKNDLVAVLAKGSESIFTVEIVFESDDDVNNDAMNDEVMFDLYVYAVQVTKQ